MKNAFLDWLKLLTLTIVLFMLSVTIAASIFCKAYFPYCLEPMITGIALSGVIAFVVSFIVFLILKIRRDKRQK